MRVAIPSDLGHYRQTTHRVSQHECPRLFIGASFAISTKPHGNRHAVQQRGSAPPPCSTQSSTWPMLCSPHARSCTMRWVHRCSGDGTVDGWCVYIWLTRLRNWLIPWPVFSLSLLMRVLRCLHWSRWLLQSDERIDVSHQVMVASDCISSLRPWAQNAASRLHPAASLRVRPRLHAYRPRARSRTLPLLLYPASASFCTTSPPSPRLQLTAAGSSDGKDGPLNAHAILQRAETWA